VNQSLSPKKIVVVNDNSTDNTSMVVEAFSRSFPNVTLVNTASSNQHLPGQKIINAFNKGLNCLDDDYEVICKFDADLIFPENYLETLALHYKNDPKLGMASGHCYIERNGEWIYENLTSKDHIRGPVKCYRKACFEAIGGLQNSMGWDTVDELVALYFGWRFQTDSSLKVKHLKPTGSTYSKQAKYLQGMALYKMRSGLILALLSAVKLAANKGNFWLFFDYTRGYFRARRDNAPFIVTANQGKFIRNYRWKKIYTKVFGA
jgi:glycosyltransferase involved in cell wall biosynthesis